VVVAIISGKKIVNGKEISTTQDTREPPTKQRKNKINKLGWLCPLLRWHLAAGSIAQWLGRWSLAGRLCLTCSLSMADRFYSVGKRYAVGQPTRLTQPFVFQGRLIE